MAKSPFPGIDAKELANQIAAKNKSIKKLPGWYRQEQIYYPTLLSIEQCSSETTAAYKADLAIGNSLIDLTGGFGVDSFYFAGKIKAVTHCEIDQNLSAIAAHNALILQQHNITFLASDGIAQLQNQKLFFDTIYIDPARRSTAGKVFMLKDCTPNVIQHLDLLLERSKRIILKTAPLLDLSAGLKELKNVSQIHIVSVKNECKELLWILEKIPADRLQIIAATLNEQTKQFSFYKENEEQATANLLETDLADYLYEPDAALLKSGAFNLIGQTYGLTKLHAQTQLYTSENINTQFPGRIFKIKRIISSGELKKEKQLNGNVIVRNYRDKAENLVKKYKIKPHSTKFLIFTQSKKDGFIVIEADIKQHY